MGKTEPPSILKKLLALAAGVTACFLILETGLRLAGWTCSTSQWLGNEFRRHAKTDWTLVCFGESMTAGAYPAVLQNALAARYPGLRFTVVDKGLESTDSSYILDEIGPALDQYHPDFVLVMTGINDTFDPRLYNRNSDRQARWPWYTRLGTYRLTRFLWQMHLREIWTVHTRSLASAAPSSEQAPPPPAAAGEYPAVDWIGLHRFAARQEFTFLTPPYTPSPQASADGEADLPDPQMTTRIDQAAALVRQARFSEAEALYLPLIGRHAAQFCNMNGYGTLLQAYFEERQKPDADGEAFLKRMLQRVVEARPGESRVYDVYCHQWLIGDPEKALRFLRPVIARFPGPLDYVEAMILCKQDRLDEAQRCLETSFARAPSPDSRTVFDLISIYTRLLQDDRIIELVPKALALAPNANNRNRLYANLAMAYQHRGRPELARHYRGLADSGFSAGTWDVYRRIVGKALARRVRVVCLQYPMLSADPLRRIAELFPGRVSVVDNEKSFLDGVAARGYPYYFRDLFGGLFGHLTPEGCNLLVANILRAIDPVIRKTSRTH